MAFPTQEFRGQTRLAKLANEGFTLIDEAFPTQEIRGQTCLAEIANEGFPLIDKVFIRTNNNKKPPNFINYQYLHSYQRQQLAPSFTVYPHGPQFSTAKFTPRVAPQTSLVEVLEDGFGYVDEICGSEKMPLEQAPLNHGNYRQAAYARHGVQGITVHERAASSNVKTARFYGTSNTTITSDDAAKLYRGYIDNQYGKPKN